MKRRRCSRDQEKDVGRFVRVLVVIIVIGSVLEPLLVIQVFCRKIFFTNVNLEQAFFIAEFCQREAKQLASYARLAPFLLDADQVDVVLILRISFFISDR